MGAGVCGARAYEERAGATHTQSRSDDLSPESTIALCALQDVALPYEAGELEADASTGEGGWVDVLVMGGDMLVYSSGGVLPATRHRVTPTWDRAASVRFSLICGMYGADSAMLEPARFREEVCGLAEWDACPPPLNAKESRTAKLYLDYHEEDEGPAAPGVSSEAAAGRLSRL